jgi:hypothetical protein
MDRTSVAHLFGTCFAEALRERVGDNGSVGSGNTAAELGRQHRIPAEYIERMTGYAAKIGAVDAVELADESTAFYYTDDYQQTTRRILALDAGRAEDRGDYAVSYAPADERPRTPAVLFPEATKDTVIAGEAEQAPKTTRKGQDDCERWYQQAISRRQENARIIAASPAPQRKDYTVFHNDPLAVHRERVEAQAGDEARENNAKAKARREWIEADRLINWLYHRPGQAQEIKSLYYDRGAHSPEDQERISAALNRLKDQKKIHHRRRSGRSIVRLAKDVTPRRYTRRELEQYTEQETADETDGNNEDTGPEQSFDPQVMAEMAAAGASYNENWDS